ncbi:zinc finger lsd1 subclass family protein, putative [Ichthyophthirius multifiliis]|uniref:Zinc finger lsd1 subclass family protein, putative n=1 Tax=Ichthyophthirius multifiliis TaxID=5932 RepID=G0QJF1_ICHMU|nr:zinc finger lsd1 subclass family protein, putative [Ichthyophthirius multifiliis]EGR34654.1 zinc finger lsd1 subclass family protein, putative [Ichthyophthirius multifiliis]|eukprot:XP_004039958.1 zinc finger lsd1 subclass family protein, putative [Ichthyophthirius multifiliis]
MFDYTTNEQDIYMTISNNLDEWPDNESLGIREFAIYANECKAGCVQCTDSVSCNSCDLCKSGFVYNDFQCVSACPNNKYVDNATRTCHDCDHKCKTCSNATNCDTCFLNRVTPDCGCPAHNYDNSNYQQACFKCSDISVGCSTCDNVKCQACLPSHFLDGNSCVIDCPAGKWGNTVTRQCANCLAKCKTCSNATNCDTCFLNRVAPDCGCPAHNYDNSNYQEACFKCSDISVGCSTCDNVTCQACLPSHFLDGNSCVIDCPAGKWGNTVTRQCTDCLAKCVTCSNSNTCDICFQNRVPQQCNCPQYSYDPNVFNQACTMCSTFSTGCASCNTTKCLTFNYRF